MEAIKAVLASLSLTRRYCPSIIKSFNDNPVDKPQTYNNTNAETDVIKSANCLEKRRT